MNPACVYSDMPYVETGMRIGLYGGSFNPPHQGHKQLAETAFKHFQLDQIWWMVTPGNPLKDRDILKPLEERMAQSRTLIRHPRIHITGFEVGMRTTCSARIVRLIRNRHQRVHFVWLMGADNLEKFHLWQHWRSLAATISLGIIDRPGATFAALASPAARALSRFRIPPSQAPSITLIPPPAWCFLPSRRLDVSSTTLRV